MNVAAWAMLSRLLDRALELPPAERASWIDSLPSEHGAVASRLRALVFEDVTDVDAGRFLETLPKIHDGIGDGDDRADDIGEDVGPYRIERKLADGGMGSVWLARRTDGMLNRLVALKLPRGSWPRADLAQRLVREREILATLAHPNIARLYDAGLTSAGQPYLALEYVEGQPIDAYVKARQLPIRARLQLFLQVTRAVAHAHARLVVHRDLKPSNILVTDAGDVKLLDFGIAKLLEDDRADETTITETCGRPLTPDYASPEQIAGAPLGIASDIYSLGVLLYELLAGTRPYTLPRASRDTLEQAIARIEPRRPSEAASDASIRRLLRGDLDTIVLKALKKSADERYATINGFADDIERYLHGEPVLARPDRFWYRLSKCVARNKVAVGAAAAVFLATIAGAGAATWQAHVALTQKAHAEEVRDFLTTIFRDASPYTAGGRALSAIDWLKQVKARVDHRLDDRPELRVELLNLIGSSLVTLQDTAAAGTVLSQAVDEATRRLGPTHPETLHARVLQTLVYRFSGRARDQRAELEGLLPLLRHSAKSARGAESAKGRFPLRSGASAEPLVIGLKNLAHLEIDDGRYAQAEAAAKECVAVALDTLGERHDETVAAFLVLAYAQQFSRAPDVALQAAERAHRIATTVYQDSPRHPRLIEGRLVYGRALAEAGRLVEGVDLLARAVRDAADVFGPSSRMVGFFSLPLVRFQVELGEIGDAIENGRRAVTIVGAHAVPEAFVYAVALHNRGAALLAARRPAEAIPDLRRAADRLRQLLPASHGLTGTFRADLALALARDGRIEEARRAIQDVVPQGRRPDDRSATWPVYVLGVITRLAGDPAEALRVQQRTLASMRDGHTGELDRMRALTESGLSLLALSRPGEAAAALDRALILSRQYQTRTSPARAEILVGLARARMATGRSADAAPLLREAVDFWRGFDPDHPEAAAATRLFRRGVSGLPAWLRSHQRGDTWASHSSAAGVS